MRNNTNKCPKKRESQMRNNANKGEKREIKLQKKPAKVKGEKT